MVQVEIISTNNNTSTMENDMDNNSIGNESLSLEGENTGLKEDETPVTTRNPIQNPKIQSQTWKPTTIVTPEKRRQSLLLRS